LITSIGFSAGKEIKAESNISFLRIFRAFEAIVYTEIITLIIMKRLHSLLFATMIFTSANAQKLPVVQEVSIYAPANVKIEGKVAEWGKLQAYNKGRGLHYTIANDNSNLYLILQTDDVDALAKITNRGIKFSINSEGKKNDEGAISFIYPFFDIDNRPYISFKNKIKIDSNLPKTLSDADSVMRVVNKRINDRAKFIKVFGLPAIDTMLSVYNDTGIAAAQLFDNAMVYSYEIAIPLKLLKRVFNTVQTFNYHVTIPGLSLDDFASVKYGANGMPLSITARSAAGAALPAKDQMAATFAATDFWGEYTLAK